MQEIIERIKENIGRVLIGKEEVTELVLAAFFAGGHVLLEDMPGTGKTVLARSLARSMDCGFSRIQFTPDLLPGDVTGLNYFHQGEGRFVFRKGPVFTNILLADEINRATPRTQSALLECMGEGQVTVDGETRTLEEPFFVIATENPVDTYGCFPLPEAQLDRFLMKLSMGGITEEQEKRMIDRFITEEPLETLEKAASKEEIASLRLACRRIHVHQDLRYYLAALTQRTRRRGAGTAEGVSPRGTLALLRASQGLALVRGREFVVPEDIKDAAVPTLSHRYICEASGDYEKEKKISALLSQVSVPTEDWSRA